MTTPDRPGSALQRVFPALMVPAAILLVLWLGFGRGLVGAVGSLAGVYTLAIGLPVLALHVAAAVLFRRDAAHYPSRAMSLRGTLTTVASWVALAAFGFFVPDATERGMESVFTHLAGAPMLGISYGFANTFGVVSVALSVALVLLALTDLRNTGRRLRGEALTEDELLDRVDYQGRM